MTQNTNFTGAPDEMLNRWAYTGPVDYGITKTYKLGMDWLQECASVEDWGCGGGWAKRFCGVPYRGIDGSPGPETDHIADLRHYKSRTPGLFMRHVLEHNRDWEAVLSNALESFQERMSLIMFMDWEAKTRVADVLPSGIVVIAFRRADIMRLIKPFLVSQVQYRKGGVRETVLFLEKP